MNTRPRRHHSSTADGRQGRPGAVGIGTSTGTATRCGGRFRVPPWLWLLAAAAAFLPVALALQFALAAVAGAIQLTMPVWGLWLLWKLATSKPNPEIVAARKRIEERRAEIAAAVAWGRKHRSR